MSGPKLCWASGVDQLLERCAIAGITDAGREGYVNVETFAGAESDFVDAAAEGVVRVLVNADEENGRVVVEHLLGAVAVVNVEVDDEDTICAVALLRMAGSDGYVAEEAEALCVVGPGVVARRPHHGKAVAGGAAHHGVGQLEETADGAKACLPAVVEDVGVGVEPRG